MTVQQIADGSLICLRILPQVSIERHQDAGRAKAALERVTLIRQIHRSLEAKSNHTLPDEFFHDTLDEHFSEEETVQQLATAINWGRYAGIFDYDSASHKFYIAKEEPEADKVTV